MPNRRFDWHEHIKDVEREYGAARVAVDRLRAESWVSPDILRGDDATRKYLPKTTENLEGTYLVRLFAAFEAALRSYDRSRHEDPNLTNDAAVLIDSTGGRRGRGISHADRLGAHAVRELRNYWAHENDKIPNALTIAEARARVQKFLSWLPDTWD